MITTWILLIIFEHGFIQSGNYDTLAECQAALAFVEKELEGISSNGLDCVKIKGA